jgi:hypothetical protein
MKKQIKFEFGNVTVQWTRYMFSLLESLVHDECGLNVSANSGLEYNRLKENA